MTAARSTSVTSAADDSAQLSLTQLGDPSTPVTFTNRSDRSMVVTLTSPDDVEFDVGDDDTNEGSTATFSIAQGASVDVDLLADGTVLLDVLAELQENGTTVGQIELQREAEAESQAGNIEFTGNAESAGASGKFNFGIDNTGDEPVTFTGIGITETSTNATEVGDGDILTRQSTGTQIVSQPIPIDSSQPDSYTRRDFAPTVTLDSQTSESFRFDKFRDADQQGNSKIDMRGEDVRAVLFFGDGSSKLVDLCLGACEF